MARRRRSSPGQDGALNAVPEAELFMTSLDKARMHRLFWTFSTLFTHR